MTDDADIPRLPDDVDRYFLADTRATLIPTRNLEPTRRRPDGVRNAATLMQAAYRDEAPKRAPLRVAAAGVDRWRILDGNSTFAVAEHSGWRLLPCIVDE